VGSRTSRSVDYEGNNVDCDEMIGTSTELDVIACRLDNDRWWRRLANATGPNILTAAAAAAADCWMRD